MKSDADKHKYLTQLMKHTTYSITGDDLTSTYALVLLKINDLKMMISHMNIAKNHQEKI